MPHVLHFGQVTARCTRKPSARGGGACTVLFPTVVSGLREEGILPRACLFKVCTASVSVLSVTGGQSLGDECLCVCGCVCVVCGCSRSGPRGSRLPEFWTEGP